MNATQEVAPEGQEIPSKEGFSRDENGNFVVPRAAIERIYDAMSKFLRDTQASARALESMVRLNDEKEHTLTVLRQEMATLAVQNREVSTVNNAMRLGLSKVQGICETVASMPGIPVETQKQARLMLVVCKKSVQ